jgi:hypothetical protein
MSIVNSLYKHFLVQFRIDRPGTTYDTNIAFIDVMPRDSEASESILYLLDGVKFVHLSSHDRWFIRDITPRETDKGGAIDAFPRTSPEFGQERYHRYTRLIAYSSLAKYPLYARWWGDTGVGDHLVVSLYEGNIGYWFDGFVDRIYLIAEFLKILFISNILVFYDCENDFINYVGIVFGHRSEYKRQNTKDKIEDFFVEKTSAEYTEVCVFVEPWIASPTQ